MNSLIKIISYNIIFSFLLFKAFSTENTQVSTAKNLLNSDNYINRIIKKINFFLIYPKEAEKKGMEGKVKLKILLTKNGRVSSLKIIKTSGFSILDKAAIWSVKSASPFNLPPSLFKEKDTLEVELTIEYKKPKGDLDKKKFLEKYAELIKKLINSHLIYPSKLRNLKGVVKLEFEITRKGAVREVKILKSSGFPVLDKLAILTVKNMSFPPFSEYTDKETLKVIVPIKFEGLRKPKEVKPFMKGREKISEVKERFSDVIEDKEILDIIGDNEVLLQLYKIGAANSQPLKISKGQIKLATCKVKEAIRALFPQLSVEYKEDKGKSITDPFKSRSYGIKLEHLLYDNKQRSYSLKRERLNLEVAKKNYEKERNNLLFEILKAYYQASAEKKILMYWKKLQKEIEKDFELAKILHEGKLITKIEYLKISSLVNKVLSELVSQENKFNLALANLKKVLGIPPGEEIPNLKFAEFSEKVKLTKSVEELIKAGLKNRPEISLWKKSIEATRLGYKIAKIESKPKLFLESFWGKSGEAFGWQELDLATTWNVVGKLVWLFGGSSSEVAFTHEKTIPTRIAEVSNKVKADSISFKLNILDKINYYSEVKEGKVALDQSIDEFVKVKKDIAWEVQEGFSNYLEGTKEIEMFKKEIELREQELKLKEELFKAGEIELSELLDTKLRLTSAKSSLIRSILKSYLGIILVDKATGFCFKFIQML